MSNYSEEQGERFQQNVKKIDIKIQKESRWYQGF